MFVCRILNGSKKQRKRRKKSGRKAAAAAAAAAAENEGVGGRVEKKALYVSLRDRNLIRFDVSKIFIFIPSCNRLFYYSNTLCV